jgi:hypothetical protein
MRQRHTKRTLNTRPIPMWTITLEGGNEVRRLHFVRRMYRLR